MFSKLALASTFLLAVLASPVPESRDLAARNGHVSFDAWGGHQSLVNFDTFYGVNNFVGFQNTQVVVQDKQLVCHAQSVEIIQQRLVVLQELAKKIIVEQICEVETQVIVFEQFWGSLGGFTGDLRRLTGHHVGFDQHVVGFWNQLFDTQGFATTHDFGFKGFDVGAQTVLVGGHNWDDSVSFQSVNSAHFAAQNAFWKSQFLH